MTMSRAQPRLVNLGQQTKTKTNSLVAPVGQNWRGTVSKKPQNYRVTAVIPHLNTPDILEVCIDLLRNQSEKPYILAIDTGSTEDYTDNLELLRGEDCEIHYLKSHSWMHPSEPVAVAQDLALLLCKTPFMFCTHADCFLTSRTLLEDWLGMMDEISVLGYQISPRPYKGWENEFGHTALMFNVLDIKTKGINWDMQAYCRSKGPSTNFGPNDPDTESNFNRTLQLSGLKYKFIGDGELNYVRNLNEHFDHPRSYASSKIYNKQHFKKIGPDMHFALREARQRIFEWKCLNENRENSL